MKQEAQSIIEFADSDINFDPAQMQALYNAVESGNKWMIVRALSEAKQNAAEMLEEEGYHEFCRYLLKGQGLLKDGDWSILNVMKIQCDEWLDVDRDQYK